MLRVLAVWKTDWNLLSLQFQLRLSKSCSKEQLNLFARARYQGSSTIVKLHRDRHNILVPPSKNASKKTNTSKRQCACSAPT